MGASIGIVGATVDVSSAQSSKKKQRKIAKPIQNLNKISP